MAGLYKRWDEPRCLFGDLAVISFLLVQSLDGVLTYLGVRIWGPGIEANPIISSAVIALGPLAGLTSAKLVAISLGIALHLRRVHTLVAALAAIYAVAAIVPWTLLLLG